jgi:hypothetical protein
MKNSHTAGNSIVLVLAAMSFAIAAAAQAGPRYDYSRGELMGNSGLQIFRVADYGYQNGLCIYIDGIPITTLARGEGYRAIVRPGRHLVTLINTPSPYGKTRYTTRALDLVPGQNYSFTAIWDVETITLEDGGYVFHGFYR